MPIRTLKSITFLAAALSKRFHGLWGPFAACGNKDILSHLARRPQNVVLHEQGELSTEQLRIMLTKSRPGHIRDRERDVIRELTERESCPVRQHDIDVDTMRAQRLEEPSDVESGCLGQLLAQVRDIDALCSRSSKAFADPRHHTGSENTREQ
jgi:hypothetical protein